MTGAIAGAFYGDCNIPPNILYHCEASTNFGQIADNLFQIANEMEWNSC
jgi:ADP-ribosylglycohydrolase